MAKNIEEELEKLREENHKLRVEVTRLKALEDFYKEGVKKCTALKYEMRSAINDARRAHSVYNTLYKKLSKFDTNKEE